MSGEHTTVTSGNMVKHTATSGPSASAFMHVPFVIGAISFFHSVPESYGVIDLDACTLAKIFKGEITRWNDAAIKALNPNFNLDQPIGVVVRSGGSSSTSLSTDYLNLAVTADTTCSTDFPDALTGKEWSSITGLPQTHAFAEGSGGVSGYLKANPYSIGYVDSGHGHAAGLSEIALKNKNGKFLNSADADLGAAIAGAEGTAAAVPSDFTDSFHAVSLMDQAGDTTWPICTFSYMYIRKDMSQWDDGPKAALVKAFAQFVLSDEGQGMLPDFGFKGIPTSLRTSARTQVDAISLPSGQTAWTFETSTGKDAAGSTITNPNDANIFSVKRQSWADVERESLVEDVAELKELVANLTAALEAQHPKKWYDDPKKQIEGAAAVGALGFIFAFVALVVGSVALNRVNKSGGGGWSNKGTMQI